MKSTGRKKEMSIVFPFRSFHNQRFDTKTGIFLLLPPFFNLIILMTLNHITRFWGATISYFLPKLGYEGNIVYSKYSLFYVDFLLPSIKIDANLPNITLWWSSIFFSIGLFFLSGLMRDSYTPLKYFLRVFLVLMWLTLLYMLVFPSGFMYTIFFYTKSGFMQILSLLFVIPWIFLFSYYFFGYQLVSKIVITSLTLIYFVILAPFQYLLNACLIHNYSLMLMPPLFFYTGLMLNLLAVVSFCGYGISKEPIYNKFAAK